jgi:hypothetical protein
MKRMKRYFFDVVRQQRKQYDYQGRLFERPEYAGQFAELMALDLGIEPDDEWSGWSICVHDVRGQHFLSVPVPPSCLAA